MILIILNCILIMVICPILLAKWYAMDKQEKFYTATKKADSELIRGMLSQLHELTQENENHKKTIVWLESEEKHLQEVNTVEITYTSSNGLVFTAKSGFTNEKVKYACRDVIDLTIRHTLERLFTQETIEIRQKLAEKESEIQELKDEIGSLQEEIGDLKEENESL